MHLNLQSTRTVRLIAASESESERKMCVPKEPRTTTNIYTFTMTDGVAIGTATLIRATLAAAFGTAGSVCRSRGKAATSAAAECITCPRKPTEKILSNYLFIKCVV